MAQNWLTIKVPIDGFIYDGNNVSKLKHETDVLTTSKLTAKSLYLVQLSYLALDVSHINE